MVEIHTLPILTADLQHYRPKGFTFGMGISGGEKEHDLVLALCGGNKAYEGYAYL
jgi:hypothetical protein